jgi:hypothetical protein
VRFAVANVECAFVGQRPAEGDGAAAVAFQMINIGCVNFGERSSRRSACAARAIDAVAAKQQRPVVFREASERRTPPVVRQNLRLGAAEPKIGCGLFPSTFADRPTLPRGPTSSADCARMTGCPPSSTSSTRPTTGRRLRYIELRTLRTAVTVQAPPPPAL